MPLAPSRRPYGPPQGERIRERIYEVLHLEVLFLFSPLYQRGARGDFCLQLLGNGPVDSLHHRIPFFQNFSTIKAHHLQTKRDQVPITTSVFQGVIASQVL